MKIKIKKIYIKNFKGIKEKRIIEFDKQTNLLIGPNGFGKTTIYDVMELCLTNKIHRTITKKDVTHHRSDYNKMFFQNDVNEDVIIKLWLSKETEENEENLIITKHLPKNKEERNYSSGRKHKPEDFYIFQSYKGKINDFSSDTFHPEDHEKLTEKEIDDFFEFDSPDMKIKDIYNLFNYLQQEETMFFLKQSENDRKESLSFLFDTTTEEKELHQITKTKRRLDNIYSNLKSKLNTYKDNRSLDKVEYVQLFNTNDVKFDKKFPFENNEQILEERNEHLKEIDKLLKFITIFDPEEYIRKQKVSYINNELDNDNFIQYYLLKKIKEMRGYELVEQLYQLKNNDTKLKAFILQHHIEKHDEYSEMSKKHNLYNDFLHLKEFDDQISHIDEHVSTFMPEEKDDFVNLKKSREELKLFVNETEELIANIIELRNNLKRKINEYILKEEYDASCPYCGYVWENYEEMDKEFINKENKFKKSLNINSRKILEIEKKIIESFIKPITQIMVEYKENNKLIDSKVMNLLEEIKDHSFDFALLNNYDTANIVWREVEDYEKLNQDVEKLKTLIEKNMGYTSELFVLVRDSALKSYDHEIKKLKELIPEEDLNKLSFSKKDNQLTLIDLKRKSDVFKKILMESKSLYVYQENKVKDDNNIYKQYFQSNEDAFKNLNVAKLEQKKLYIEYLYLQSQSQILKKYESRITKLKVIIDNISQVKESMEKTIKKHKYEMANNIKLPFYIYTAKILQNYQQGMGVFLSTKEDSDAIKFITDPSSDHDAIHHLSSGQLAVASIAFTLAINKTYNISKNLLFLAIDDPIQEMDSMNIYSFVELIKSEFLNDYQLIFSTHNDNNAAYMKYKFEKANDKEVSLLHVQRKFFN